MTLLAPILQSFFTEKLIQQRQASPHTIAAYRDTVRLLLIFAHQATGVGPWRLELEHLDVELISTFLQHLEVDRGNSARTRNARLAAIHSLFRHAALQAPEQAATIQRVLALQGKRTDTTIICFLTDQESQALLAAPDRSTWIGRRDHALLLLALRTGLRVSELTQLTCGDIHLGAGAHVQCLGKGENNAAHPFRALWSRSCEPGWPSAAAPPAALCSAHDNNTRCPRTRSRRGSPNIRRPPPRTAHPLPARRSPRTPCGTPPP